MDEQAMVFTVPEVADQLCVSKSTIYRLIRSGQIRTLKVGELTRVRRRALEQFLERAERIEYEKSTRFQ
jgi:excisionase family DNA binding protein